MTYWHTQVHKALLELLVAVSNVGVLMAIRLSMQEQGQLNRGVGGVGGLKG